MDFDHGNDLLEEKERWKAFDLESVSDVFVLRAIYFCQNSGGCLSRQDFRCSIVFWLKFLAMTAKKIKDKKLYIRHKKIRVKKMKLRFLLTTRAHKIRQVNSHVWR